MNKLIFFILMSISLVATAQDSTVLRGNSFFPFRSNETSRGIKEALIQGINKGVDSLSQKDGYFADPVIKIPFPEDARKIERKLRQIGLGDEVDRVILSLNRAAEKAAPEARDIFIDAVKQMKVEDAVQLVSGGDNSATNYLESKTSDTLIHRFQPIIHESLEQVEATRYWNDLVRTYNKIPFVQRINPDLDKYVTEKAVEGLFIMIAREEKQIRENPAKRTTELLQKVFGSS